MQLFLLCLNILFFSINCILNTFTIDFSFLLPDTDIDNIILDNNNNDSSLNISIFKNFSYYYNIKPMIKFCIGSQLQCFLMQLSFNSYETVLNLNSLNFSYKESSSFKALMNENSTYAASDTIKLGNEHKNLIEEYNFIITNDSELNKTSEIGLGRTLKYSNIIPNNEYDFSLLKQLNNKKIIETSEITIKYLDDFSGEIILGTNYTGMNFDESQYLELPNTQNSLNGYLQSIYIEDATISSMKQQKDLLAQEKRKRVKIDFNSTFITLSEDIFEQIKKISFTSYINAQICEVKKNENLGIQYLICNDDIMNSNLDTLFIVFNWKKNISVSLNDLFLPYKSSTDKKTNILGIISSKNNETLNIGTVLLKKYMICLNREKNNIRLYLKNIETDVAPTDLFGIVGIITLTVIICILIIYMVSTICGKDKYEPNYSPNVQKFLTRKALDKNMQSNESF